LLISGWAKGVRLVLQVRSRFDQELALTDIHREVMTTLLIGNRSIKRHPALSNSVAEALASLANAGVRDRKQLTISALLAGRRFIKRMTDHQSAEPCEEATA
jgi:hypothetical protein